MLSPCLLTKNAFYLLNYVSWPLSVDTSSIWPQMRPISSLFVVSCHFQHCTGHITMSSFVGRGNQFIQLVKVLYCKLLTNGKKLPTFPHMVQGLDRRPQRWETNVLVCRGNKYLILFELFVPLKSNYNNYFSSFFKCWLINKKSIICQASGDK